NNALPVVLQLLQPEKESTVTLNNGKATMPVEFEFRHVYSRAVVAPDQVLSPGTNLEISFRPELGKAQIKALPKAVRTTLQVSNNKLQGELLMDYGSPGLADIFAHRTLRITIHAPASPWQEGVNYLGIDGSKQYWLSQPLQAKESWWSLWPWGLGAVLILIAVLLLFGLLLLPGIIGRSDRRYKRKPRLVFSPHNSSGYSKDIQLEGVRSSRKPVTVFLSNGDPWKINKLKIKRRYTVGASVEVVVTFEAKNPEKKGKKGKKVKMVFKTADDRGSHDARHRISGLDANAGADFVLFAGRTGI
ncbi:MAG: hypothetical protein ACI8WB_003799, partial [Phenylobacterium sp.]